MPSPFTEGSEVLGCLIPTVNFPETVDIKVAFVSVRSEVEVPHSLPWKQTPGLPALVHRAVEHSRLRPAGCDPGCSPNIETVMIHSIPGPVGGETAACCHLASGTGSLSRYCPEKGKHLGPLPLAVHKAGFAQDVEDNGRGR